MRPSNKRPSTILTAAALANIHGAIPSAHDVAPPPTGGLPNGMQSMGPVDQLGQHPDVASRQPESPVVWLKDEAMSTSAGIDMFYPFLEVKGISNKIGASRPFRQFFTGEREMFVQAFANDVALFLFCKELFNVVEHADGVEFAPNPEFAQLPTRDVA